MGRPVSLGHSIREARAAARERLGRQWTLDRVADEAGLTRSGLVAIERGDRLPMLDKLLRLHAALPGADGGARTAADLTVWLARWARAHAERAADGDSRGLDARLQAELRTAAELLDVAVTPPPPPDRSAPCSLADFPARFAPAVALVGDRRERPPRDRGDLFVAPAAITDAAFLPLLRSGAISVLRSDKLVAVGERVAAGELAGFDLMVIGGPNVNAAARLLNPTALFRFDVPQEWEDWTPAYRSEPHLGSPNLLAAFTALVAAIDPATHQVDRARASDVPPEVASEMAEAQCILERLLARAPELGGGYHTEAEVVRAFSELGHCDPVAGVVHGRRAEPRVDHGLVSLAPSPFDPSRLAILVGGRHGPGTAHALRFLLEHPDEFAARPYGGVFEVWLGEYREWSSSFQQPASVRWLTPEYGPEDLLERMVAANPALASRTERQLEDAVLFVDRLRGAVPWPEAPPGPKSNNARA